MGELFGLEYVIWAFLVIVLVLVLRVGFWVFGLGSI